MIIPSKAKSKLSEPKFIKNHFGGIILDKVVKFLNANPVQYLATVGRDGKAKCRPFMFAGELDGKMWFCTNNQKEVYKDMQENPEIEISVSSPDYAWIRLHGKAVFGNNMAAKEMCIRNPIVKSQYDEATNPIFEVFYLEDTHGPDRRLLRQSPLRILIAVRAETGYHQAEVISMTQAERRLFLIRSLMNEKTEYAELSIPRDADGQRQLL